MMKVSLRSLPVAGMMLCAALMIQGLTATPAKAQRQYTKDYVGEMQHYTAVFEDTLVHLARQHGLGYVEMRTANPGLDPWIPGEGAKITLPTQHILPDAPREGIVINLPEMRLYFFPPDGSAPQSYSISPGREGLNTPVGSTAIQRRAENPTWRPTARMRRENPTLKAVYGPGPDNPLGTHALYLGWPEYLIHGTDKPYAIGRRASSGCIRMYPEAVLDLYPRVPVGTPVTVVDQPVKVGWIDDKLYIEVSPTQEQSDMIEQNSTPKPYEITDDEMGRINEKAASLAEQIDWDTVRRAVREQRGYPVMILDPARPGSGHDLNAALKEGVAELEGTLAKVSLPVEAEQPGQTDLVADARKVPERDEGLDTAPEKAEETEAAAPAARTNLSPRRLNP